MDEDSELAITQVEPNFVRLWYAKVECGRAIGSFEEVDRLTEARTVRNGVEVREYLAVFNAIRLSLHFTANISKLFWPLRNSNAEVTRRCSEMRELVGLPVDHPLSDRRLRDHFEHLDERLDKWVGNQLRPFTAIEMILEADMPEQTRKALCQSVPVLYDEVDRSIHILGEKFALLKLLDAVKDVQSRMSLSKIFKFTAH